ncbi:hypothetical protein ERO13_A10G134800v2 [Gossypium hirsutum]|uniref:Plant UBX domain-containing protein 11 isoform X1 n=3 Tax=Gossypium TaxID=3633 RepID=A0A1U8J526_GOSHI|nr:plant UBX domain-containing protein 11 isoform X1 [Gossypium hirsutum]KAG4179936.1 hypothetical protein ERO13_A10G134800v2 [Gossypium hirsutum]TYI06463.1 hypothetical protein ES332_A10G161100v1 [Gossypium tomentosum]
MRWLSFIDSLYVFGFHNSPLFSVFKISSKNSIFFVPKMERSESLSPLTYKGSIPEAIREAQNQKKLFVVYISGENDESKNLDHSTWTDLKVKESLSKYCILLHIRGGTTDAANFSAIYPQKSIPCITAIGFNGLQAWQNEGFVSAEVLASSLEKAWLSLHIQETTAAVLGAALASKKLESSSSGASTVSQSEQGSSSTSVPSTTMDGVDRSFEPKPAVTSGVLEGKNGSENTVKEKISELVDQGTSESFSTDNLTNVVDEQCNVSNEATRTVGTSITLNPAVPVSEDTSSYPGGDCFISVKGIDHRSSFPGGTAPEKAMQHGRQDGASENTATTNVPTDVHLNIRLPDGSSLQEKFPVGNTLRMIKDYVDRNQSSGMGSYDLAIPYPRKLFGDQDLSTSLLDLGLLNRQALIVVPRQRSTGFQGQRSFADQRNSTPSEATAGSNGGYFAYVRSFMSYFNPFSYLGGGTGTSSSTTGPESQSGIWEYSPNPTLQNNLAGANRTYSPNSTNRNSSTDSRNRRPTTSRYGSNIHTLKHDEDDSRFSDRNPFWNGNSTQYGGNSDNK